MKLVGAGLCNEKVEPEARDAAGRLDLDALDRELRALGGVPALVIASAGEVNVGDFDPVDTMADLAEEHGAWLHVDGAFGLFATMILLFIRFIPVVSMWEQAEQHEVEMHHADALAAIAQPAAQPAGGRS